MRHGSLFAGVDAVSIAVEALGGRTVWNSEVDDYCNKVLALRFPDAERLGDVQRVGFGSSTVDLISGGFPCQGLSVAGNSEGLDDSRSGLWSQYVRVIDEARPSLVLIENVARLLRLHFERVIGDLRDVGFDCEWDVISAASAGAPHLRERIWVLAYPRGQATSPPRVFGRPVCVGPVLDGAERRWPRAGMMVDGVVFELDPVVPRKTKRIDGKSYWVGVDLFDARSGDGRLIPTPVARDWKGVGLDGQLGTVAARGLLPTPAAVSYGSNQGGAAGRVGKKRHSLESLARLGLMPGPPRPSARGGPGVSPKRQGGMNLRTVAGAGLWSTPKSSASHYGRPREHEGGDLQADVLRVSEAEKGLLNADWVEWMMGLPVGWTDLYCEHPVYRSFDDEPLPRVIKKQDARRPRLTAIGNSLVWLIPYWILSRYDDRVGLPTSDL